MNKQICLVGLLAAIAAAPAAHAGAMPAGSLGAYYSMVDAGFDDGDGFGLRGWASLNGPWFVHGEYAMLSLDDSGADVDEMRVGGGFAGEIQRGTMWLAKGEYIDFGGDADSSGFGVHGGLMFMASDAFGLFGTIGYLSLSSDAAGGDSDGLEFNVGGKMAFTKEWCGVVDYRSYGGETDAGADFDNDEIRLGASYSFY
jgi:hypothetical protein